MQMQMVTETGTVEVDMYKGGTSKPVAGSKKTGDTHGQPQHWKKRQKKTGKRPEGRDNNQRQPTTRAEKKERKGFGTEKGRDLEWKKTEKKTEKDREHRW